MFLFLFWYPVGVRRCFFFFQGTGVSHILVNMFQKMTSVCVNNFFFSIKSVLMADISSRCFRVRRYTLRFYFFLVHFLSVDVEFYFFIWVFLSVDVKCFSFLLKWFPPF